MIIKINKDYFSLICLGIFLTPTIMRVGVLKSQWGIINPLAWIGVIALIYYKSLRKFKTENVLGNIMYLWVPLLMFLFILSSISNQAFDKLSMLKYIYATLLPGIILYVNVSERNTIKYLNIFCNYLIVACTFVVVCGLLDFFFSFGIGNWFAEITGVESSVALLREGRMVSYYGHALLSSELMILCFSFNTIREFYFKRNESLLYTFFYSAISIIGIGLSGSKTGLILLIVEFIIIYINPRKIKYTAIVAISIYGAYRIGLINTVLNRLLLGVQSGDLSTGRNTYLSTLWRAGILEFKLFKGHAGTSLTTAMIGALEYPPLRWAYLFGIWFSVIICIAIFVIPLIKLAKSRNFKVFFIALIIILDVNSYSGLATQSDHMLIYCLSMFLLLNISRVLKGGTNEALLSNAKFIHFRRSTTSYYNTTR